MSLRVTPGRQVDVLVLHPVFVRRLEALFEAVPVLSVYSGVRTVEHQRRLYAAYLAGTGNLAANPDRVLGTRTIFGEQFTARGSWHMQQETGFGYAVDLHPHAAIPFNLVPWHSHYLRGMNAPFGLTRTVQPPDRTKWEPWHVEPLGHLTTRYDHPAPISTPEELPVATRLYIKQGSRYAFTADGGATWQTLPNASAVLTEHRSKICELLDKLEDKTQEKKTPQSVEVTPALFDWLTGAK